ncbi:hypothetical protein KAJ27_09530 [bacterium]|nr:hypothetical protein [bacterium]
MKNKSKFLSLSTIFIVANIIFIVYISSLLINTGYEFVSVYDDSYIFYQYADQFLKGNFFQYHDDMVRTDGVTSKLYLGLILLIRLVCPDNNWLVIINYLTGHLFFLISIYLFYKVMKNYMSEYWSLMGTLCFTLTPNIQWAFYSNMDSQLFVFLFIIFLFALVNKHEKLLFFVTMLFIFTRPEAVILSLFIMIFVRQKKYLIPFFVLIIYFVLRKLVFGTIPVNSFVYSSFNGDFFNLYPEILKQFFAFIFYDIKFNSLFIPGFVFLSVYSALGHLTGPAYPGRPDRNQRFLAFIYLFFCTLILFMNYPRPDTFLRYLTPMFPLTLLFFFLLLNGSSFCDISKKRIITIVIFLNILMSITCAHSFSKMGKNLYFQHISTAKWLNNCTKNKSGLLCGDVGVFGFFTKFPITDLVGLVSKNTVGMINYGDGLLYEEIMRSERKPDYAVLFDRLANLSGTSIFKKIKKFDYYDKLHYRSKEISVYELDWKKSKESKIFPYDKKFDVLDSLNVSDRISEKEHEYKATGLPGQEFLTFVKESNNVIDGGRIVNDEKLTMNIKKRQSKKPMSLVWRGNTTGAILIHLHVNDIFIKELVLKPDIIDGEFSYYKIELEDKEIGKQVSEKLKIRIVNPEINLIPLRETFYFKLYSVK